MPSDARIHEKRRGERVLICVPVQVKAVGQDNRPVEEDAETAVVSRFGALIRVTSLLKMSSTLEVTHGFSHEKETFRVVWVAEERTEGRWDTGVEAVTPVEDFWGIHFPTASPAAKERKA